MRETQKRVATLRARKIDLTFAKLNDENLYAVGFELGYGTDVRNKEPYLPRREPTYVLGHAAGRRRKAIDIAIEIADPFSDESRLRAAEARYGGSAIRQRLWERYDYRGERDPNYVWDWTKQLKYVAALKSGPVQTPIRDVARNHITGYWTRYLRAWRINDDMLHGGAGQEILPADAVTWPVYQAALGHV